jgi:hypothetical protein
MKRYVVVACIIAIIFSSKYSSGQVQKSDTTVINIAGLDQYKKDRTTGKAVQLIGTLALGTYFVLENSYEHRVREGDLNAEPPSRIIPIAACGVMAIGIIIDMGAVEHLFKRKKPPVRVSTDDYQF